jgi:NADPH:quinone reductase-like Zn-dependent oxidoreductase/acyl carrier protein
MAAALAGQGAYAEGNDSYLPSGVAHVRVYGRPGSRVWCHTALRSDAALGGEMLEGDIRVLDETGQIAVEVLGLRLVRSGHDTKRVARADLSDCLYKLEWRPGTAVQAEHDLLRLQPDQPGSWLIFTDSSGVGQAVAERLRAGGETCFMVSPGESYKATRGHFWINPSNPADLQQLLKDTLSVSTLPCRGVLHLWSLEASRSTEDATSASLDAAQELGSRNVLLLVQALHDKSGSYARIPSGGQVMQESPRLWLITRGAQAVGEELVSAAQAPLWGLGRVIAFEHPEFQCVRIDLDADSEMAEAPFIFQELWSKDGEDQITFRHAVRYVPRLVRMEAASSDTSIAKSGLNDSKLSIPATSSFSLDITRPGQLDMLRLQPATRIEPGPGQVEIEVYAAGLNYRDVLNAMGVYPGDPIPLGAECTGRIARIGTDVEGFEVGDEVIAIAPASFSRFATTSAALVVPKPDSLNYEEAATIPVTFLTAHYALNHLARMRRGERVLIHAAAGGVGLSAVQLAQRAGAEVFATAGTPEKRAFLQYIGVKHVMDSRSFAFVDEVMQYTGGKGVDIVLNSLPGEYIPKSLSLLASYGRFLEIGKMDIYLNRPLDLYPFYNNLSYFAIDLDRLCRDRPALIRSLFVELMEYFKDGSLRPLPRNVFPISEAVAAFRYLTQRKNIGKVVVSLHDAMPSSLSEAPLALHADATYLITGGLGSLGLLIAQWMVQQGVRQLVLMGRHGAANSTRAAIEALEKAGARVVVAEADITREEQVASVLAKIEDSMPPLRGIIHAAGILDDGLLVHLDQERLSAVMAPKVQGAWNLHILTKEAPLDFFVLFSSVASILGSPGQGSYAAANAFLDALSHQRRALGLPSLTINWGPWAAVGMAARSDRNRRFVSLGMDAIVPQQGLQVLERLLSQRDGAQVMVVSANWQQMLDSLRLKREPPLLSQLVQRRTESPANLSGERKQDDLTLESLLAIEPDQRQPLLIAHLQKELAIVLGLETAEVDPQEPLNNLGLDSLMMLELRQRLENGLGIELSIESLIQDPNLIDLSVKLLARVGIPPAPVG